MKDIKSIFMINIILLTDSHSSLILFTSASLYEIAFALTASPTESSTMLDPFVDGRDSANREKRLIYQLIMFNHH